MFVIIESLSEVRFETQFVYADYEVDKYRNRSNSSRPLGDIFSGLTPVLEKCLNWRFRRKWQGACHFRAFCSRNPSKSDVVGSSLPPKAS